MVVRSLHFPCNEPKQQINCVQMVREYIRKSWIDLEMTPLTRIYCIGPRRGPGGRSDIRMGTTLSDASEEKSALCRRPRCAHA
jgi:hypothetical protein